MALFTFPYQLFDAKLADPAGPGTDQLWKPVKEDKEGEMPTGEMLRDLVTYPPNDAVRKYLGVRGLERLLEYLGLLPGERVDGWFGRKTKRKVKQFQRDEGITADGIVGPQTSMHLFFPLIDDVERALGIFDPSEDRRRHLLFGLCAKESSFDPGIVGSVDPQDRGPFQINRKWHGTGSLDDVCDEEAWDPVFAAAYAGDRMGSAFETFLRDADQGTALRAAVLQHRSPAGAKHLVEEGEYQTEEHRDYVRDVYRLAKEIPE